MATHSFASSLQRFDELYADVCGEVERNGNHGIDLWEMLKVENCELAFSPIISQPHPSIVEKFTNQIQESYELKNENRSRELLHHYQKLNPKNRIPSGQIEDLQILNTALRLAPYENENDNERMGEDIEWFLNFMNKDHNSIIMGEKDEDSESGESDNNGHKLLTQLHHLENCSRKLDGLSSKSLLDEENENLLAQIYLARSRWFEKNCEHESCILDSLRAIKFGSKEQYYSTILTLGISYKRLGQGPIALDLFQYALNLLRQSSIDNSLKSTETMKIVYHLKELKSKSTYIIPKVQRSITLPNIYGNGNSILLSGSDTIELKFNVTIGRHLRAKTNIPAGSTLIVESPYASSLYPKMYDSYCQHCFRAIRAIIPCKRCSAVVFCKESCRDVAESYHKFECSILNLLISSETLGEMGLLAYRTITRTELTGENINVLDHYGGLESEANFILSENEQMGLDKTGRLDSKKLGSVLCQRTNSDKRSRGDILKRSMAAIYLTLCLRHTGYISIFSSMSGHGHSSSSKTIPHQTNFQFSSFELKISNLFFKILQSVTCNAYGINSVIRGSSPRNLEIVETGGGTYPTVSTLNHSCAPTTYRYYIGSTCIVKSLCDILAGDEIFDSYGPTYMTEVREIRQGTLSRQYFFRCECLACQGNWALYSVLRIANESKCTISRQGRKKHEGKWSKSFLKEFQASEEKYLFYKDSLISSDGEWNREDAELTFSHHLSILQKGYSQPNKLIVECQELLKVIWNLSNLKSVV